MHLIHDAKITAFNQSVQRGAHPFAVDARSIQITEVVRGPEGVGSKMSQLHLGRPPRAPQSLGSGERIVDGMRRERRRGGSREPSGYSFHDFFAAYASAKYACLFAEISPLPE